MDRVAFVLENASFLQILSVFEWKKVVLDLPYKNKVQFYTRTSTNGPNLQLFLVENASNGSKQEALVAGLKAIQVNTVISLLQSAHQERYTSLCTNISFITHVMQLHVL
jgi:hypothetical protein